MEDVPAGAALSLEAMRARYWLAVDKLGLDHGLARILEEPERELCCSIPLQMDDGAIRVLWGCRVQHSTQRGPAKGGIVFGASISQEEVRGLAAGITWKHAVVDAPFGGAKGGIRCNIADLSAGELERLLRRYTTRIIDIIGPDRDIPSRDIDSTQQMMAWIYDTFSMHTRQWHVGVVTGKPEVMGGSRGCLEAPGFGVYLSAREACKVNDIDFKGARIAVSGFGGVGEHFALFAHRNGARIIAVGDGSGALLRESGLDIPALVEYGKRNGALEGFPEGQEAAMDDLYEQDCDVFALCALDLRVAPEAAVKLKARIVVEGSDGCTTPTVDEILDDHGVFVVPDILANTGAVLGSYTEWVQDRQGLFWTREEVLAGIEKKLVEAFDRVYSYRALYGTDMRNAAYVRAVESVATVARMRGIYA